MFAPMTPMTERIRHQNESRLTQNRATSAWSVMAALRKALSVNRQENAHRDVARGPARPIEGSAAKTAC